MLFYGKTEVMRETRVNLKHLLEDIRDSYAIPLEEVILVELVANALDSGACRIDFFTDNKKNGLTALDNGKGMKRANILDYHNIAATTKKRGKGIGFAGVGAKLSLLVASTVVTESKGGYGSRCATEWYLKDETSAPWKFVPCSGKVPYSRGTAVTVNLESNGLLLDQDFIRATIAKHFYPLFQDEYFKTALKHIYKKGVEFFVNKNKITVPEAPKTARVFRIRMAGRGRGLEGCGFLATREDELDPAGWDCAIQGLAISTFGKVIKSGWEWIGIEPQDKAQVYGVVEVPALVSILTLNKMDFLKTAGALKRYYTYRKAIQRSIMPIMQDLGEASDLAINKTRLRSLALDIERTLRNIVPDFPELVPLLGIQRAMEKDQGVLVPADIRLVSVTEKTKKEIDQQEREQKAKQENQEKPDKKRDSSPSKDKPGKQDPAITIGFENRSPEQNLARMVENKIWINTSHPAYFRAQKKRLEQYHIVFCVAWALSSFLDIERSPQDFINNFLASWGRSDKQTASLLKPHTA